MIKKLAYIIIAIAIGVTIALLISSCGPSEQERLNKANSTQDVTFFITFMNGDTISLKKENVTNSGLSGEGCLSIATEEHWTGRTIACGVRSYIVKPTN